MSYKTILVEAGGGSGSESRIRLAARLAQENGAELIGATVRLPTPLVEVRARGVSLLSVGLNEAVAADEVCRDGEAIFTRIVAGFPIEASWRPAIDVPTDAVASMATAADLVVAGSCGRAGEQPIDAGELIMRAGRPVLVTPNGWETLGPGPVVVAWKNTREARRALSDALPLLKRAASVTLLHAEETKGDKPSFADPLRFLASHGIGAESQTAARSKAAAGERIIAHAHDKRADLIVLGAFGHSRAREWAFGGVTRDLLAGARVPCLFSR